MRSPTILICIYANTHTRARVQCNDAGYELVSILGFERERDLKRVKLAGIHTVSVTLVLPERRYIESGYPDLAMNLESVFP